MGAKETVAQFLELSRHRDERSAELLHPDVDYTMSLPTIRGKRNVLRFMRAFGNVDIVHIASIAADGDTVLSERIDLLRIGPLRVYLWVNARFTVHDGLIISWRDYGDPWELAIGLFRAVVGILLPGVNRNPPAPLSSPDG